MPEQQQLPAPVAGLVAGLAAGEVAGEETRPPAVSPASMRAVPRVRAPACPPLRTRRQASRQVARHYAALADLPGPWALLYLYLSGDWHLNLAIDTLCDDGQ